MVPVLLEWDLQHPHAAAHTDPASTKGGAGGSRAADRLAEFCPVRVLKVQGSSADEGWRYVMEWRRTSVDAEGLGLLRLPRRRGGGGREGGSQLVSQEGAGPLSPSAPLAVQPWDQAWLKAADAEHRAVRMSVVRRHWPELEQTWQHK